MADGWATFGKGVFIALAVAGGVWIGRGGNLPVLEVPGGAARSPDSSSVHHDEPTADREPFWLAEPREVRTAVPRIEAPGNGRPQEERFFRSEGNVEFASLPLTGAPYSATLVQENGANGTAPAAPAPSAPQLTTPQVKSISAGDWVYTSPQSQDLWIRSDRKIRITVVPIPDLGQLNVEFTSSSSVTPALANGGSGDELPIPGHLGNVVSLKVQAVPATSDSAHAPSNWSSPLTVRIASGSNLPTIQRWSNHAYGPLQDIAAPQKPMTTVTAYDGFLRLRGTGTSPSERLTFVLDHVSPDNQDAFEPGTSVIDSVSVNTNGEWTRDLHLPVSAGNPVHGRVVVFSQQGSQRAYATAMIPFVTVATQPGKIELDVVAQRNTTASLTRTNNPDLDVKWKNSSLTADAVVVLVDGNVPQESASLNVTAAQGIIPWTIPTEGRHTLKVALVRGKTTIAESPTSGAVDFNQHGPRAAGVEVVNQFKTRGATVLRIPFDTSHPLAAAPDVSLFKIRRNSSATDQSGATLTFDATDNSVQLTFANGLEADGYTLTIIPAIDKNDSSKPKLVDVYGNVLGAEPSNPAGKSFTFTFFKSVGEELPSQSRGLAGVTGENAVYPEYTKPRPQQDGFNPSDKVVTRIARLYYFRDAHRVVQLLNREARSFNRQAVDQQQQLADNALRDAENATTDRREAERAAVRAAQQARAAENGLVQAQAALAKAQSETTTAGNDLPDAERAVRNQQTTVDDRRAAVNSAQSIVDSNKNLPQTDPMIVAAQASLDRANADLKAAQSKLQGLQDQRDDLVRQRDQATARVTNATRLVNTALAEVQASRTTEITATDKSSGLEAKEDQTQKTLFRREVAAASADPDTYARGNPESVDPLLQVSYSVIGEGEIQLRGPLKGVNLARTLINQIDSPVGQVRVAIHTIQVNGERGERMEPVVERIGRYVDQSRFLTSQSGQMLRNAVTMVAARKAEEAFVECEGFIEADHQVKYLEAFFGKQFIDELREMDSEFLRADNKLLSLHSMDSTSLAQALFLLALAKNDIRQEILCEFERLTTCELPLAETEYFGASGAAWKFGPPFHKQKYQFLGHNARFMSLRGQFNVQVADPDTITPMQREFIRLAQIFKSRLVAEREIQQRVMERGLIEERIGVDFLKELREARDREVLASQEVDKSRRVFRTQQGRVVEASQLIEAEVANIRDQNRDTLRWIDTFTRGMITALVPDHPEFSNTQEALDFLERNYPGLFKSPKNRTIVAEILRTGAKKFRSTKHALTNGDTPLTIKIRGVQYQLVISGAKPYDLTPESEQDAKSLLLILSEDARVALQTANQLRQFELNSLHERAVSDATSELNALDFTKWKDVLYVFSVVHRHYVRLSFVAKHVSEIADSFLIPLRTVRAKLSSVGSESDVFDTYVAWLKLEAEVQKQLATNSPVSTRSEQLFRLASDGFRELLASQLQVQIAREAANNSRRPLDYKKFMDMLVDDAEDKYIEILEGTRAHTANIDNYLGRIITSLDDDFNAQFYNPTFKHIREAGRYWDVQMGQIETTTVLTNNRTFAKVSPQAQMEFDLPKRDILISEAFESAAAAYQDYGALLQDPTFLSLTKMYRGQPPSATYGSALPTPMVRDVLPGLPSATNEKLMIQEGTASPDFPSALESLIPDPAIYKFETGTGFEVRPVIQPDGQAVTFHLNYMYTTNVREPVRADEKHLGRIKRHFVDTDVTLGNFEMREVSKYTVALKASRTARGVPLLEDVPVAGILFRPLPQQQSSLQQNVILSQATIFPTLFDLMGLRWAPAIADLGAGNLKELDFVTKNRRKDLQHRVFDYSSSQVDEFLRIPEADRRRDLYRPQTPIDEIHPDGSVSPGMNLKELRMMEETVPDSSGPDAESSSLQLPPGPALSTVPDDRNLPSLGAVPVIQQQSYQVPAKDTWRSAKPQRLPQITPGAPRKPAARPAEPKRLPVQDKPGSVKMLGPQSSRSKLSAESPIVLTSATRAGDDAPLMLLDRSEDDLFAAPEIRPVSELRSEPRDDAVAKDAGKRRWFKLPFLSRSK